MVLRLFVDMDFKTLYALKKLAVGCREKGTSEGEFMRLASGVLGEGASFYDVSDAFYAYAEPERLAVNRKKKAHKRVSGREYVVATQFFTPDSTCEYLAENGIQALCMGGIKGNFGKGGAYLDVASPADGKIPPEKIKVLDPAVGTGNLLYAVARVLVRELVCRGFEESDAKKIVASNIFGLDLDASAVALAKKRLEEYLGAEVGVYSIGVTQCEINMACKVALDKEVLGKLKSLNVVGSLAEFTKNEVGAVKEACNKGVLGKELGKIATILSEKFDFIIMNPPYLSSSDYGKELNEYVGKHFAEYRADLFAVFAARAIKGLKQDGCMGLVAPYNWMFLKQFEPLRRLFINDCTVKNLVKMPPVGYLRAVVYLSATVIRLGASGENGSFIDASEGGEGLLAEACSGNSCKKYFRNAAEFANYPMKSFAFWLSGAAGANFECGKLSDVLEIRQGLATGNNKKFLRKIKDVPIGQIDFTSSSLEEFIKGGKRYALYNKGGKFRKWFGNRELVIDFSPKAREELAQSGNHLPSKSYYFKKGVTWTLVSSKGVFCARLSESSVFDVGGSCGFPKNEGDIYVILAYLCSKVATFYLAALNPTVNTQVGDLKNLPYIEPNALQKKEITALAKECTDIAEVDWQEGERAIATPPEVLASRIKRMRYLEERLNVIFIGLYGLQNELSPAVKEQDITLRR